MPSSTSNSDLSVSEAGVVRPGFVRLTASDRPGVAQPVPARDVPAMAWGPIWLAASVLAVLLLLIWEVHWRAFGAEPSYRNSDGLWAQQRHRINQGEGGSTVLIGSSRVLFDVQLSVWEKSVGEKPIQLALEGTSAVVLLEDLAADPDFTGRLLVGVAPDLFFTGFAFRGGAIGYSKKQGPSERMGNWISQILFEPYLAFYDPDFALGTVLKRQPWPLRPGMHGNLSVRKLSLSRLDRNTRMWSKVENDADYAALAQRIWAQHFSGPPPPNMATPEKARSLITQQIDRAVAAVKTLHSRGVPVVFVRLPSAGEYLAFENKAFPRAATWDVLLARTSAPGVHFEDYPALQGYTLPEWSHVSGADADRLTAELAPLVEREFQKLSEAQRP